MTHPAGEMGNCRKIERAVNDRPYKLLVNIFGGAVRRERVGEASKNVS